MWIQESNSNFNIIFTSNVSNSFIVNFLICLLNDIVRIIFSILLK